MSVTGRRSPTIRDVAAAAGVSVATVSRVLNGGSRVSPEALQAVTRAIERTGYRANRHARALSAGRSHTVALVLTEPQERLFEDPTFSTLLREVARELNRAPDPLTLVLVFAGTGSERERAMDFLTQQVDGVLVVSSHRGDPLVGALLEQQVPLVASGRPLGQDRPAAFVAADDLAGARAATRHLLERGRGRIATIAGPLDTSGGTDRLAGFREVLGERLEERHVEVGDYTYDGGAAAMRRLLAADPALDAVFVASDLMAAGALSALRQAGRRVPDDVAVVGFDDSSYATASDPPLTTVRQPWGRIAAELVRVLVDVVDGGGHVGVTVPTELVVRGSS